jgi:hypothetical protein
METITLGLKRLRRVGALGVAGGLSLVVLQLGLTPGAFAWLLGALLAAELTARGGAKLTGENASHALWISPVAGVLVSAGGALGLSLAGDAHGAQALCVFGSSFAMLQGAVWGALLGALSAWCES